MDVISPEQHRKLQLENSRLRRSNVILRKKNANWERAYMKLAQEDEQLLRENERLKNENYEQAGEHTCQLLPTESDLEITVTSKKTGLMMKWSYRRCSECRCNVFEGAKFCTNCGAKVVEWDMSQ